MSSIRDLATSVKIIVVPVSADIVAKVGDAAYQAATIPANTYDGQTSDVPTVAIRNFLVSHTGVSNDDAYQMAKSMFDNLPTMVAAHNAAKAIDRATAMQGTTVPFHPGAEKFYREAGILN